MVWVRMKRSKTSGIYVLILFSVLFLGTILSNLNKEFSPVRAIEPDDGSPNELEINSQNQVDDLFYTQNDTHYQNYSRITEWEIDYLTEIKETVVRGNITFLATWDGFHIYNITNREFPSLISQSFVTHYFDQLYLDGDFAYLSSYYQRNLVVLNISDLTNPIQIHSRYIDYIKDIYVDNGIVFIAQDRDFVGLKIYDYQDMENIVDLGEYSTADYELTKLAKKGSYLFCLTDDESWEIFDVTDLENPILHSTHSLTYDFDDFYISGNYLYLFDYYFLHFVNIEDVNNVYSFGNSPSFSGGRAFAIHNNYAYVVVRVGSFLFINVYNITDYYDITLLVMHDNVMPSYSFGYTGIHFEGDLAVISSYTYGFRLVNVSDPMNLTVLSEIFGGEVYGVTVEENFALVEIQFKGFILLNITDPLNVTVIARVFIYNMNSHVFLQDNLTYCCINNQGLVIYNITNLHSPQLIGECSTESAKKIVVQNNFAYLHYSSSIEIVNVTNPFAPISIIMYGSYYRDFTIHQDLLIASRYLGTGNHDLDFVDISDPFDPILVTRLPTTNGLDEIVTNGTFVFASRIYSSYIEIYNIENIASPFFVTDYLTSLFFSELLLQDNLLYIVNPVTGLTVYEFDDQLTPSLYGLLYQYYTDYDNYISKNDYSGDYFYLVNNDRIIVCGFDSDKDYLADYLETELYGTDPFDSDSDDDLIWDWFEVTFNLDPLNSSDALLDYDNDTLTNYEEFLAGSNPWLADTDSDLLTDDLEVLNNTDPNDPDTDNDDLTDFEEVLIYFTDPIDADTDDDNLLDGNEVIVYGTDPLKNDTDDDLMDDWYEVYYSLNPFVDDTLSDLDLDGLTNLEEYFIGTAPNRSDTDWDGYTDFEEIENGTDPLDRNSFPDYSLYPSPTVLSPVPWFASTILALFVLSIYTYYLIRKHKKQFGRNN